VTPDGCTAAYIGRSERVVTTRPGDGLSIISPDGSLIDRPNGNTPSWVKAAYFLGVPSVIALGVVYYLVVDNRTEMRNLNVSMNAHIGQMEKDQAEDRLRDTQNRQLLWQICQNTARTTIAERGCNYWLQR
jgi:hypothetical protein